MRRLLSHSMSTPLPTEEKEVSVLFSDLRGFTALAEHYRPIEVIRWLNRYFATMAGVIQTYGGEIDKLMGDAMLVVFSNQQEGGHHALRAVNCAVAMQIALDRLNSANQNDRVPPLYMGIGVNSGRVVAGQLGSDLYNEYTVIGDHVNLASRIESYSLRGQVLISEHTYAKVSGDISVGLRNTLSFKGKQAPVNVYECLAVNHPEQLIVPQRDGRKSPRVSVNMPLSFQQVQGKTVSSDYLEGQIIDMSYGGMYVASPCQLEPHSEIRFPLALSLSSHQRHDVYARVLGGSTRQSQPGCNEYHVEFSHISPPAQAALKQFIDRLIAA